MLFLFFVWNRNLPGFKLMAAGAVLNGFTMSVNGGKMPVWEPTLRLLNLGLDFKHSVFTEFPGKRYWQITSPFIFRGEEGL